MLDFLSYVRFYLAQEGIEAYRLECKDMVLPHEGEQKLELGAGYLFIIEADAPIGVAGDDNSFFCLSDAKTAIQSRMHKGTVTVQNRSQNSLCHLLYLEISLPSYAPQSQQGKAQQGTCADANADL